jgi:hypothetical protein
VDVVGFLLSVVASRQRCSGMASYYDEDERLARQLQEEENEMERRREESRRQQQQQQQNLGGSGTATMNNLQNPLQHQQSIR